MKYLSALIIVFFISSLVATTPLQVRLEQTIEYMKVSRLEEVHQDLLGFLIKAHGCLGLVHSQLARDQVKNAKQIKKHLAAMCHSLPLYGKAPFRSFQQVQFQLHKLRKLLRQQEPTRALESQVEDVIYRLIDSFEKGLFSPQYCSTFMAFVNSSAQSRRYTKLYAALAGGGLCAFLWWVYSKPWDDEDDDSSSVQRPASGGGAVSSRGSSPAAPRTQPSPSSPAPPGPTPPQKLPRFDTLPVEEFEKISQLLLTADDPRRAVAALVTSNISLNLTTDHDRNLLYDAVVAENAGIVELLVANGARADVRVGDTQTTALHRAAVLEEPLIMQVILAYDKRGINQQDARSNTPVMLATRELNADMVRVLTQAGADMSIFDAQGLTPLLKAIELGATNQFLDVLLECGAHLGTQGEDGDTPLHAALRAGNRRIVEYVLAKEVDTTASNDAGGSPLHEAVRSKEFAYVRALLEGEPPEKVFAMLTAKNNERLSPLGLAEQLGDDEMVDELLGYVEYNETLDERRRTMLHHAVVAQEPRLVSHLCGQGACITDQDLDGDTPLHLAAGGDVAVMNQLLCSMREQTEIDTPNNTGATPLHVAVNAEKEEVVELLLQFGANLHARDTSGKTPLDRARERRGSRRATRIIYTRLKNHGEYVSVSLIKIDPDDRWEPVHYAAKRGDVVTLERLIAADPAVVTAQTEKCKWTPLHIAALFNHARAVALLLAHEHVDKEALSHNRLTPMGAAAGGFASKELLAQLKEGGCRIDGNDCWHPLTVACQQGKGAAAEALIELGSTIDHRNDKYWTPLEWAAFRGNVALVRQLLEENADPSAVCSAYGLGPLHFAARKGRDVVVEELLDLDGVDINVVAHNGMTPLHEAACKGHESTVKLLLRRDADRTKLCDGKTAEELARDARHFRAANIIKFYQS